MRVRCVVLAATTVVGLTDMVYAQSGAGTDPAILKKLWYQENEKCRGGFGDDPRTDAACAARQTYDAKLRSLGWCYELLRSGAGLGRLVSKRSGSMQESMA